MKSHAAGCILGAGLLAVAIGTASAADRVDPGRSDYEAYCAVCHGMSGKGDGPYRSSLKTPPSDLTLLARSNGGTYPFERVYQVVDGRADVAAHGTRDMPIWGRRFGLQAGAFYVDAPYDAEAYIRARVLALTEYVYRLQAK